MQGVDVVITGVGVVAVVATVLGVVFYDVAAGVDEISFEEVDIEGSLTDSADGGAGMHDLTFDLPDNATAATGEVTVTFTGQAGLGGTVNFDVWFIGPNGTDTSDSRVSGSFTLENGDESGSDTVELPLFRWYDVPGPVNATDTEDVDKTVSWDEPLTIRVEITNPEDQLIGAPGNIVTYSYDVEGEVELQQFRIAPRDVADPDAI